MPYFIANFKQHFNLTQLQDWLDHFHPVSQPNTQIIIAGSYHHLPLLSQTSFAAAAQNISHFAQGLHTGSISVNQIKDLVTHCLIGHPQARIDFGDTDQTVALKARLLIKASITPIVCLDLPNLQSQIDALQRELLQLEKLIFAYEPADAVGTGKSALPQKINETAYKIKTLAHNHTLPVVYGGSLNPDNISDYTKLDHLDGFLVGSASLDPVSFATIISRGQN